MKIAHIVPGSGGTFYCQNCLRDTALVRALRARGHDVMMVPLYLPMFVDSPQTAGEVPVFFGGINVYLQQRFSLFRKTPAWLDRAFDASWMLRQAAACESSTNAADLGPMTVSMLLGAAGNQRKELRRLIDWLRKQERPDVTHISNALLLGLAAEIRDALNVPLVCTLQDEDTWIDAMLPPYNSACLDAMAQASRHVDAFVAVSHWYADRMRRRLQLPPEKMRVVHLGIETNEMTAREKAPDPPVIGFLSRLCPSQGLDRLVDAFLTLKQKPGLRALRLRATGGITPANAAFLDALRKRFENLGVAQDVDFLPEFDKEARRAFLRSLSVLSVPTPSGEAFGAYMLEALNCGVPVVQPAVGAFPEIVEATGGGILYDPQQPGAYEDALATLLLDPEQARTLGERGRAAVLEHFDIGRMAERMEALYLALTGAAPP